jgi:DNA processing protein
MAFERIGPAADEAERFARLRLVRTARVGPVNFVRLMQRFGSAVRALDALPDLVRRNGGAFSPPARDRVERELAAGQAAGARLILMGDSDYPALLVQADGTPPALWALGPLKTIHSRAVAIVGARNASAAGQKMAAVLAHDLGEAGFLIVAGLARGIDTRAHEASLKTGTVAVLGGGIDDVYPPENAALYARMREYGLLLSESPVGYTAQARDFPRRNRIISALSLGTVVVEAELRSGSLITARLAAEQNREVFAVPGSPLDPRCRGGNDLLRQGANLCESADDVIRVLDGQLGFSMPESGTKCLAAPEPAAAAVVADAEDDIAAACRRLRAAITATPVPRDDLVRLSGAAPHLALVALSELEIAGVIEVQNGLYTRVGA